MTGDVPCNGCTLCCRSNDAIAVSVDHGDDVGSYDTVAWTIGGQTLHILKHNPDGSCAYLKDGGCSIYERRPAICRAFDCRRFYVSKTRAERKAMIARGLASKGIFDRGRALLPTLDDAQ